MESICKNCQNILKEENNYCSSCGAKVIRKRIQIKRILAEFFENAFGWDNKFFQTSLKLITDPSVVLGGFINGTRKKFMNPISYLAILTAISLLVYTQSPDRFEHMYENIISQQSYEFGESIGKSMSNDTMISSIDTTEDLAIKKERKDKIKDKFMNKFMGSYMKSMLKYYNLISFLSIPFVAFLSFLVFRKPYNYGEHIVINAYLQGFFTLVSLFFFLFIPSLLNFSLLLMFIYYIYVFHRFLRKTYLQSFLSVLKFFLIILIIIILSTILMGLFIFLFKDVISEAVK